MTTYITYGIVLLIVIFVLYRRVSGMSKPVKGNGIRLLIPVPIFLALLLLVFNQLTHINILLICAAILLGVILSLPLIYTTNFERRPDGLIYPVRNKQFFIAIIALVVIRIALRSYLMTLGANTEGVLFLILAVAYITPWRIASYIKYRRVNQEIVE